MFVAYNTHNDEICGYVLGKVDDEKSSELKIQHGHITSLAVKHKYRRMGIAASLME